MRYANKPCGECPWRCDQPAGRFPAERYDTLRSTISGDLGAPIFACHKSTEGKDITCAGWLAVEGHHHLGVRMAVLNESVPVAALSPAENWPDLYERYEDMAAHNGATEATR